MADKFIDMGAWSKSHIALLRVERDPGQGQYVFNETSGEYLFNPSDDGAYWHREQAQPSLHLVLADAANSDTKMDHVTVDWRPIETVPDGRRVLLWLERGEKGNGEIAVGMILRNEGTHREAIDCYWTWGGPNSGSDIDERPTKWAWLPLTPDHEIHG